MALPAPGVVRNYGTQVDFPDARKQQQSSYGYRLACQNSRELWQASQEQLSCRPAGVGMTVPSKAIQTAIVLQSQPWAAQFRNRLRAGPTRAGTRKHATVTSVGGSIHRRIVASPDFCRRS